MSISKEQKDKMSTICNKHFSMTEPDCGCGPCPMYSICCLPKDAFNGATEKEKTEDFERRMWALAEHVDMSAYV